MSSKEGAMDLDETSFNLESVDIVEDDVAVHNHLICEDQVGVEVSVEVGMASLHPPPIDEEKKKEFERNRDQILSGVPEEVKSKFGEIYFSSFGKTVGPVLIMNPYMVEPGPLRKQWLGMFRNCQKVGRESDMTHLTYWYGFFNDLRTAYSFQKTAQLIPYEKGMEMTEKKLNGIKKKRDAGKKLNKKELNFMKGFEEMERDRPKDPAERNGYVGSDFLEEYHLLEGETKQDTTDDQPKPKKPKKEKPKKEKPKSKVTPKPKATNVKKTKIKTAKGSTKISEQTTHDSVKVEVSKDVEPPKLKKKSPKKRIQKEDKTIETSRPKKKAKSDGSHGQETKISTKSKEVTESIPPKSKEAKIEKDSKDDQSGSAKGGEDTAGADVEIKERRPSAYEEYQAILGLSSDGEDDDGSVLMDDLSDDDDEVYEEDPKPKASKKKTPKKKTKVSKEAAESKEVPKKKAQKTKTKIEKSVVRVENNRLSESSLQKLWKMEQRKFQKCETEFLPLLRRWDKAIDTKDVAQLSKIYKELLTCMEQFTAPFILEYGMSDLMKRSKGYNNELRKQVLSKFKEVYKKKNGEVPEGFKPTKKSEKKVPRNTKSEATVEDADHSKPASLRKEKQNPEKVVSVTNISEKSQDVLKTSLSSGKIQESGSNKDLTSLCTIKSRNGDSTKDLTSLARSKSRNGDSNKDLSSLSANKSDSNKNIAPETSSAKVQKSDTKIEPSSQKQSVSSGRPEKKRFSLGKLMRTGTPSSQLANGGKKQPSSSSRASTPTPFSSNASKNNQNNPTWIIQVVSNESYSNENRAFGLEFLQQAALYVPGNKEISSDAIARNIESAIYNWSMGTLNGQGMKQEEERWNDYWNKIHDLAACIGGKRQTGTLAKMIGDGKFATPEELVRLDDDDLWNSFKGLPLSNYSN